MKPVNILKYKIDKNKSLGRNLELFIDERPLLDLIEESIPNNIKNKQWHEKIDAKIVCSNLLKSTENTGKYELLTCAHCESVKDLMMEKINVEHIEDFIIWKIKPPGSDIYFDEYDSLKFSFHKPQYQKVINELCK